MAGLPCERLHKERLLDVEPVLCLFQSETPRTVENLAGDFLTAMGRQAMHRDGVGSGEIEQLVVDLTVSEGGEPRMSLLLLAHRYPHVGVDRVGVLNELAGIVSDDDASVPDRGELLGKCAGLRSGPVPIRMGEPDL